MTQTLNIVFIIFVAFLLFVWGYLVGSAKDRNIENGTIPQETKLDRDLRTLQPGEIPDNYEDMKLSQDDVINHEGVGIIHRPTVEELNIANEDENTRLAKQAVAETIRNTPEPTI